MNLNKIQIIDKIAELKKQEQVLDVEISLNENDIYDGRQDCMWYGGDIGYIRIDKYIVYISAYGDIRTWFYENGEEKVYVKDKSNNGRFYDELHTYIKNDDELNKISTSLIVDDELAKSKNKILFVEDNNWLEYNIFNVEKGEWLELALCDNILESDDVLEAFENIQFYIDVIRLQENKEPIIQKDDIMDKVVKLKDGRVGKVIGAFRSGEYMLESGKGGTISYFTKRDLACVKSDMSK